MIIYRSHGLMIALALGAAAGAASAQAPGGVFKDCADCPEMVAIPAGTFQMGRGVDPYTKFQPPSDVQPPHTVSVKAFAIGKYEVTQEQWTALMGDNPSQTKGRNLPVEQVSWDDVQLFIQKLNAKTKKRYRLPTEAEWEYAARAGTATAYSFGDDEGDLGRYAWHRGNSGGKSHPVGEKLPNNFGLHDIHGNVSEWVQDCYTINYVGAPGDGSAAKQDNGCRRVARGGSWLGSPESLWTAYRYWHGQADRNAFLGLRLARSLP